MGTYSVMGAMSQAQKQGKLSTTMGSASLVQYYCSSDSGKEIQKQPVLKREQASSLNETVIPMKRKKYNNPEEESEETIEVSTELNLVHQGNNKRPKTNCIQVSTKLKLFDDSWHTADILPVARAEKREEVAYSKIARMKYYRPGEEQEEKKKGVSTQLKLYIDPWNIKKRLTQSDLGHLCRLLVQTSLVEKYVLPFLSTDAINKVERKEGLGVIVWDQDTQSEHKLILKKWLTCKSYVFIDGWSQKFVNRRNLKAGDEIGLYWDPYSSRFNFRVLVRVP